MFRKLSSIFFLSLFLTLPSYAQAPDLPVRFGAKAGASLATLRVDTGEDEADDRGYQTDFVLGVYGQVPVNELVGLQAELLYARKGSSTEESFGDETFQQTTNLDYIEAVVVPKVKLPLEAPVVPSVHFGPYLGYAVNRTIEQSGGGMSNSESISDGTNALDLGVALGAGIDVPVGERMATVGVRYDFGLLNVSDDGDGDSSAKNSAFLLTLGFAF